MELQDFYNRINLNTDLNNISKNICNTYNLGKHISDKILEIGYEDFNYILTASTGKYFIKILYSGRDAAEAESYVKRINAISNSKVSFPKALKINNKILYNLKIDKIEYRIIVFEYINGENLFTLNHIPDNKELKEIAKQIKYIHNIDIKPEFIYDSWAICNFIEEYNKKEKFLPEEYKNKIKSIYDKYKKIDMNDFKYAFVHGDVMNTNVMKDNKNKLWIIDIAVSNYLPRIVDLAVTAANLCTIKESKQETYKRISILLEEYTIDSNLTPKEKENFKLFFDTTNAMYILQSSYQKNIGNISEENNYWFEKGCTGLKFSDDISFNKIFNALK